MASLQVHNESSLSQNPKNSPHSGTRIRGLFSTQKTIKVGTGTTSRKTISKMFMYAEELDNGMLRLQPINKKNIPCGKTYTIDKEELLNRFSPEPERYMAKVYPQIREKEKHIAKGDRLRSHGQVFTAEMEYQTALGIDENSVRATFGIGLCYLEREENEKAKDVFNRLKELPGTTEPKHKHLFNDFGISLRKNGLYQESVEYYQTALELEKNDEHLYFNLARALFHLNQFEGAKVALKSCLEINSKLAPAIELNAILNKRGKPKPKPKSTAKAQVITF